VMPSLVWIFVAGVVLGVLLALVAGGEREA
jgi:hypothetical protein